jgi:hypothetical protein
MRKAIKATTKKKTAKKPTKSKRTVKAKRKAA